MVLRRFELDTTTYYVGAMAAFGVVSACFTNIAITTTFNRDAGVLKRLRGTPLPASAYMAARVVHAMVVGALLVAITLLFGMVAYDSPLPTRRCRSSSSSSTFLVGSLSFAALALALTAVIPNAEAAPPIVNAAILPLLFLSGIFIPLRTTTPAWITTVADIFPVKHFADAMRAGFLGNLDRDPPGSSASSRSTGWMSRSSRRWGIVGLVLAARFFSWEPRR